MIFKAISLTQPWASLMAIGAKVNETRSRAWNYQGDVAIVSTKEVWRAQVPNYAETALKWLWHFRDKFPGYHANIHDLYLSLPFGKIVCVVEKTGCFKTSGMEMPNLSTVELEIGNYSPDRFFYPTRNFRQLKEPIPWRGTQGIYEVEIPDGSFV